jgi:hypothetical protein
MKKPAEAASVQRQKSMIIRGLYAITIIIMFLGVYFSIFSLIHNISFKVLTSTVPGAIFGLMVSYLGLRYFYLVKKLKTELYKETAAFSWKNFKKQKKMKRC